MNIIEFLDARIGEDEKAARAASLGPWRWEGDPAEDEASLYASNDQPVIVAYGMHSQGFLVCSDGDRKHIARHDPARVLAECAAKRAVVAMQATNDEDRYLPGFHYKAQMIERVIRTLAAVYADHPDYRQKWAL